MSRGFTLVEVLVVTGIIVLITALTLPNYRSGAKSLALQRAAYQLAQSLRMAQEYAVSTKEFNGAVPAGYGVYFDLNQPLKYVLFADLNDDQAYSGANEKVAEVSLETSVALSSLVPKTLGSSLTILFVSPDPSIIFNPDAALATITLGVVGASPALEKSVEVNKAGLIAIP